MKRTILIGLIGLTFVTGVVFAFSPQEYSRVKSPDGRHIAVAQYHAYLNWLPTSPGDSGGKRGWIVIFTRDGKKVGKAEIDMVWRIRELRWTPDFVEVPLVVTIKL